MRRTSLILAFIVSVWANGFELASAKSGRGVLVKFEQGGKTGGTDFTVLPNFELYVPADQAPSAFLQEGAFQSEWQSEVRVARRESYRFTVETSGSVQLFLKEKLVLETNGVKAVSEPIELGRGYNPIKLRMKSPSNGDAFLRLRWESRDWIQGPLPERFLKYTSDDPVFLLSHQRRDGKKLFETNRCIACHAVDSGEKSELTIETRDPSFDGMGSRRQESWLVSWIRDPKAMRETATMPDLLHGESESEDAAAIAAWLANQRVEAESRGTYANGDPDAGRHLVESLHCAGCHQIRDQEAEGERLVSLETLEQKFIDGTLVSFLLNPSQHYDAIRMPDFQLSVVEAEDIASFLLNDDLPLTPGELKEEALIARGRELVSSRGCFRCHESTGSQPESPKLVIKSWSGGCLSDGEKKSGTPDFRFSSSEKQALTVFAKGGLDSLQNLVAHEYAADQLEVLNCAACHGVLETVPSLALIGEKLKPEWSAAILEGSLFYKPRPWLESRMPGFGVRGKRIAQGLAMLNGFPPETPKAVDQGPAIDDALAEIGKKLISANGGLACVTCHAVGEFPATAVFESNGINFAYANERLQPDFFHRWIMKPTQIDPETKMPVYFFGGESPLPDVLEGKASDQIKAMWEYFKQGFDIEVPE